MLSDLQLVYMVPRNSTQLLKINTTKFQVEREPVYRDYRQQDSLTNIFADVLNFGDLQLLRGAERAIIYEKTLLPGTYQELYPVQKPSLRHRDVSCWRSG